MAIKRTPLFNKIYRLHLKIVKELNNSHIFVQRVIPLIEDEINTLGNSTHTNDRVYQVPARKGKFYSKEAFRTDLEIKQILRNLADTELYENLLVTNISKFESYIFQTIKEVIQVYPKKLFINIPGVAPLKSVSPEILLKFHSIDDATSYLIEEKLIAISYAKPKDYLTFIEQVLSTKLNTKDCFGDYIEMKATRDLIIHNSGFVNDVYKSKVGDKARADIGEKIKVDRIYFDNSISTMKRISGLIKNDTELKFNKTEDYS